MGTRSLLFAAVALSISPVFGQAPNGSQSLSNLPLSFEPNLGQTDGKVRFFARSQGMIVYFTDNEVVLSLHRREKGADGASRTNTAAIRMKLTGGRPPIEAQGLDPQPGVSNYYTGEDPKGWRTSVPHYGRVSLNGVYDGIDLVSYGNQQKLEYDFVVAPGADPTQVQLAFEGVDSMTVNGDGDLQLHTPIGDVIQKRPVVYQNSANGRVNVAANYAISPSHRVSVELARYDTQKPLVIDPVVMYSTYLTGSSFDQAAGVAVDNTGAAYVTGWTASNDFPHTIGQRVGSDDAFVTKLSTAGNSVVYSTFIGGNANDHGNAIAVDQSGSAYITGDTDSNGSFPYLGGIQTTFGGGFWDGFVVKLSPSGTLAYSTYLGGNDEDKGYGIAVDAAGSAYVTGYTYSTNFPTSAGAYQTQIGGNVVGSTDAFVTKIGPGGTQLAYSTYLGGSGLDYGRGIAVDAAGSAYVTGWTFSSNFPAVSPFQASQANQNVSDAFVTKLDPLGKSLIYSTCLGGAGSDQGFGIAVDSSGAAYVTGTTLSANFPTLAGFQMALGGNSDAFVTKVAPAGNSLVYSSYLGGSLHEIGYAIALDSTGAAYVAGYTQSTDFPILAATQATNGGGNDAFVANINPAGNALVYSTYLGGSATEMANGIAVDVLGAAFVVGYTESANFPTTAGAFQTASVAAAIDDNAFVTKLSGNLTPIGAKLWSPTILGIIWVPCCSQTPAVLFAWGPVNGAASYRLDVGTTCGGTTYFSQNVGLATSETVTIPLGTFCARLTTLFDTVSVHYDFTYHMIGEPKGGKLP